MAKALARTTKRRVKVAVPSHYFLDLSTTSFYGMEFRVPANAEEYLVYRFGKDWRIPKKDWTYYEDDGAVVDWIYDAAHFHVMPGDFLERASLSWSYHQGYSWSTVGKYMGNVRSITRTCESEDR